MQGDDRSSAADLQTHGERRVQVQQLLAELSRREVLALAASVPTSHQFRWASLGPDSGLTEDQEDFVDFWTPDLVLKACRAERELICALDEWALTTESPTDHQLVDRLLRLIASGLSS
jgi:hypothetical protein